MEAGVSRLHPDQELLSHLLLGVRLKVDHPFQLVLQPHLASLSFGFVNVHKELLRLIEKGYFSVHPHPPFLPWFTLPSGSADRKLEPGRPRRTCDGGAPRRGEKGATFMVDADGQRTLSLNLAAALPPDDLARGTHFVFYDAWSARLEGRSSPRPSRSGLTQMPARAPEVLLLFSGEGVAPTSLAQQLITLGCVVHKVDILVHPAECDLGQEEVVLYWLDEISRGRVDFVFASPPCASASVAPSDTRPKLRSAASPWGVAPLPRQWAAYVTKHNKLFLNLWRCLDAAEGRGTPWAVENPAPRNDPESPAFWPRYRDWGTLWDCLVTLGCCPEGRDCPVANTVKPSQSLVAACAFGARYQKWTMFWSSLNSAPLRQRLQDRLCTHASHEQLAHGTDEAGNSRAAAAAQYTPGLAEQLALGMSTPSRLC